MLDVCSRQTESTGCIKGCVGCVVLTLCLLAATAGCRAIDLHTPSMQPPIGPEWEAPRELSKVSLPTYRIQPPDMIQIETIKLAPRPPYRIEIYDVLQIRVMGTLLDQSINGYYLVEGEGTVSFGPAYGTVQVAGMTVDEASREITRQLHRVLEQPEVSVLLARSAGAQEVSSFYQVQPDGMVNLRRYGMVHIAGKTVMEARQILEQQLAQYFDSPQIAVDILNFNSQKYYVIVAGAGYGENIQKFQITGNETVLDAISQIQGVSRISSKTMWVARATPSSTGMEEVMPVDYTGIARGGKTDTNYQLLPGDRLYIVDDKLVATDNYLAKVTSPIMRLLSISTMGSDTVANMQTLGRAYNLNRRGL